jgi:hypothetical protein
VFHLNYVNDDESTRRLGSDSQLLFTAPTDADYLVRISDVRGFGGAQFPYTLTARPQRPDFSVSMAAKELKISPGSGKEVMFNALRNEGFTGPIRIEVGNLPSGFTASTPLEIEGEQPSAIMLVQASNEAAAPDEAATKAVTITATGLINGKEVTKPLPSFAKIELAPAAKLLIEIQPGADHSYVNATPGAPLEFSITPGQTISALVRATRKEFKGGIELGKEDCGRNLPHGLYVDNIGLNGLLIVPEQTEREFFITASPIAKPGRRLFHLTTTADGGQASQAVWIKVVGKN